MFKIFFNGHRYSHTFREHEHLVNRARIALDKNELVKTVFQTTQKDKVSATYFCFHRSIQTPVKSAILYTSVQEDTHSYIFY